MAACYVQIQDLLERRSDLKARLALMPYDGYPEIKTRNSGKYLYVRKRTAGKQTSTYVAPYSIDLHDLLMRNAKETRAIRKELRQIEKKLLILGFEDGSLSVDALNHIAFARANLKTIIYDQAVLEGIDASYLQVEAVLENDRVSQMKPSDIVKILNLQQAWQFILELDVLACKTDCSLLCLITRIVNARFKRDGGRLRQIPVTITGSSYVPPVPDWQDVEENITKIVTSQQEPVDIAIQLALYCMKTQIFRDGNKRTSLIFANHYLMAHAGGLLVIAAELVSEFKKYLITFYETGEMEPVARFLKENCWRKLEP